MVDRWLARATSMALLVLLIASGYAPAAQATDHEAGPAAPGGTNGGISGPCVRTFEIASSYVPVAGQDLAVEFSVLVHDPLSEIDPSATSASVYRPDGETKMADARRIAVEPTDDADVVRYRWAFDIAFHEPPTVDGSAYTVRMDLTGDTIDPERLALHPFGYDGLAAVDLGATQIEFADISPGQPSAPTKTTITNLGNLPVDVSLAGTDLVHEDEARNAAIPVAHIHYDTQSPTFAQESALGGTPTLIHDFDLGAGPDSKKEIHWYLDTPRPGDVYLPAGNYGGTITIGTVGDPASLAPSSGGPTEPLNLCDTITLAGRCAAESLGWTDPGYGEEELAFDPGFAYEDIDGDRNYTEGIDRPIPLDVLVDDGHVLDPPIPGANIVIPRSVGPFEITGPAIFDPGPDGGLIIHADVTATNNLELRSGRGLDVRGSAIHTPNGHIDVIAAASADLRNATLDGENGIDLDITGGLDIGFARLKTDSSRLTITTGLELAATQASLSSHARTQIDVETDAHLRDVTIEVRNGAFTMFVGQAMDATCLDLLAKNAVDVFAGGPLGAIHGTITSETGAVEVRTSVIDASKSVIVARNRVTLDATTGMLDLVRANITSETGRVDLLGEDTIHADGLALTAQGMLLVDADDGDLMMRGGEFTSSSGRVRIVADQGDVLAAAALVSHSALLHVQAAGLLDWSNVATGGDANVVLEADRIDLRNAAIRCPSDQARAVFTAAQEATLWVEGFRLDDADDVLDVDGQGVEVIGQPLEGRVDGGGGA